MDKRNKSISNIIKLYKNLNRLEREIIQLRNGVLQINGDKTRLAPIYIHHKIR